MVKTTELSEMEQRAVDAIKTAGPDGASKENIIKATGTKAVYSLLHNIKHKGVKIVSHRRRYHIKTVPTDGSLRIRIAPEYPSRSQGLPERLSILPESEREECLEYIRLAVVAEAQAAMYKQSVENILNARNITANLRKEIQKIR